jgi:drug/metabolite transporter (DMT)-like permease
MQNKMTFYLTLGSTITIAFYGVVGALYAELLTAEPERPDPLMNYLVGVALTMVFLAGLCFAIAYYAMKKAAS